MAYLRQIWDRTQDRALIRRAKADDRKAFAQIIQRYQKTLYGCVAGMVRDHDAIDDVLQETFIRFFQNLHRFDESFPIYPWLRKVAVNQAVTLLRSAGEKRRQPLQSCSDVPTVDPDPQRLMESRDLQAGIERALSQLPEEQRTVFMLRIQQEMSYEEIAATLSLSIGTVMSRLSRARSKLRQTLFDYV